MHLRSFTVGIGQLHLQPMLPIFPKGDAFASHFPTSGFRGGDRLVKFFQRVLTNYANIYKRVISLRFRDKLKLI